MGARGGLPAGEADGRVVGTQGEERPRVQGHEARNTDTSSVGRNREADPLRAAGRSQFCRHLDICPGRPQLTSDLQPARE